MSEDLRCDYATDVERIFGTAKARWRWQDGSPVHAIKPDGLHTDAYDHYALVEAHPGLVHALCRGLLHAGKLSNRPGLLFVGAAMGGVSLAHECAKITSGVTSYVEKRDDVMQFSRFSPGRDRLMVPVDDMISTGRTTRLMLDACLATGAEIADIVLTISYRGWDEFVTASNGRKFQIVALMRVPANDYAPQACPHCRAGSEALVPTSQNWHRFVAG